MVEEANRRVLWSFFNLGTRRCVNSGGVTLDKAQVSMHLEGDRVNFEAGLDLVTNRLLCSYRELNSSSWLYFRAGTKYFVINLHAWV
jgi:hypothetical protein